MPVPTDPYNFANDTIADGEQVDARFAPLYAALDGALDHANAAIPRVFHAYRSSALVVATNPQVIVFDGEQFDTAGWFDTATGRFTPQVAGYYRMLWRVAVDAHVTSGALMNANLQKNGVTASVGSVSHSVAGSGQSSEGSKIVVANGTTDYFTVSLGGWVGTTIAANAASTFFCGELIGRS